MWYSWPLLSIPGIKISPTIVTEKVTIKTRKGNRNLLRTIQIICSFIDYLFDLSVSPTNKITEIILAKSAPPAIEIIAVVNSSE